jgi:hypothetical protein
VTGRLIKGVDNPDEYIKSMMIYAAILYSVDTSTKESESLFKQFGHSRAEKSALTVFGANSSRFP